MLVALLVMCAVLVLVMAFAMFGQTGPALRRRVVVHHRPSRTVTEDVVQPGTPTVTRRVTEYR